MNHQGSSLTRHVQFRIEVSGVDETRFKIRTETPRVTKGKTRHYNIFAICISFKLATTNNNGNEHIGHPTQTILSKNTTKSSLLVCFNFSVLMEVQVGKDQEKAQSEKDSHSKNRGGKKTN